MNKSTLRTINVLELISENKHGITLTEISKELNIPKASTSDILKSLLSTRMVEKTENNAYRIGIKNLLLGNAYLANIDVVAVSMSYVDNLAEETGNTVFLGKLIDNRVTYLYKREPRDSLISTCRIGSRANLSTTALGKIAMAYNPHLLDDILAKPLPQKTQHTITLPEKLKQELAKIRSGGYSIDNREHDDRIMVVGFPIFDESGKVEHAIGISGAYQETRDIVKEVWLGKEAARKISQHLGYSCG